MEIIILSTKLYNFKNNVIVQTVFMKLVKFLLILFTRLTQRVTKKIHKTYNFII